MADHIGKFLLSITALLWACRGWKEAEASLSTTPLFLAMGLVLLLATWTMPDIKREDAKVPTSSKPPQFALTDNETIIREMEAANANDTGVQKNLGELAITLEQLQNRFVARFAMTPLPKAELWTNHAKCLLCGQGEAKGHRGALYAHIRKHGHGILHVYPAEVGIFKFPVDANLCEKRLQLLFQDVLDCRPAKLEQTLFDITHEPQIFLGKLDSGESALTLLTIHCALAPKHSKTRSLLLNACKNLTMRSAAAPFTETVPVAFPRNKRELWGLNPTDDDSKSAVAIARGVKDFELALALMLPQVDALQTDRIITTLLQEKCPICLDSWIFCCEELGELVELSDCKHRMCKTSIGQWIEAEVENQKGVGEVLCPCCPTPLSDIDIRKHSPSAALCVRAERLSLEKVLLQQKDWKWCPQCPSGGFLPPTMGKVPDIACGFGTWMCDPTVPIESIEPCRTLTCVDCNFEWCKDCRLQACKGSSHWSSGPSKRWLPCEIAQEEAMSSTWKRDFTKACPECKVLVEHDGGCSHMKCAMCKYEWCWICEGKYQGTYVFAPFTGKCKCKKRT